jgi:hypothetical protein
LQTIINPKGNATRAQVAAMLHRFITLIEEYFNYDESSPKSCPYM